MYNIPCNKDILQASSIPLATVITPFAETGPSEVRIMMVMGSFSNDNGNAKDCAL